MTIHCEDIARRVGQLFVCTTVNEYLRIRTPYLYPDGDVIDLFIKWDERHFTVTDLGETLRWLSMQMVSWSKTKKQLELIGDICLTHGVELFKGMLTARAASLEEVGEAVTRVSQAALRLSDLWFTFRVRSVESLTDEVEDFLKEKEIPFERGESIPGRSGRVWRPDFHTRHPNRSALVYVMSTGSRSVAKVMVESVVASWYDLSHLKLGKEAYHFVSLFDDAYDVWKEEDFKLVSDLSEVAYWSKPDTFMEKLAA